MEDRVENRSGDPIEARLAALETRLQHLEDEVEIQRLVASYGPAVDAGIAEEVAGLWTEEGGYDVDGMRMDNRAEIDAMVRSVAHQGLIGRGATHFLGPARVTITGDDAVAVCHSILVVFHKERYVVARSGANRWQLRRTPTGWRTVHRTTRTLDGSDEARALLRPV